MSLGVAGRSAKADVRFALAPHNFVARHTQMRSPDDQYSTTILCGCQPCAEEGVALLEKAAGQGHVYAMNNLGMLDEARKEYTRAAEWCTQAGAYTRPLFSST